jgi:hypothetical protein
MNTEILDTNKRNQIGNFKRYMTEDKLKQHYEKIKQIKYTCVCCNKEMKLVNKTNHNKTKKHTMNEQLYNAKLEISLVKRI